MSIFKNLRFSVKILLLGIGSVLITILGLVATVVWQSNQFNALAQNQFRLSTEADLNHIAQGTYNMIEAQDQAVHEQVDSSLNVARLLIHDAGEARLADEKIEWLATNEATQQAIPVQLPKMNVGDTWLGQHTARYDTTPIVDHAQLLVGGTTTIFQRMNEQGDMLRVATNVLLPNGLRAIGTYIPAVNADGSPNDAIAAVLRNSIYRGSTVVVDSWYNAAYAPIRDESGQVIGMVQVGFKQENVDSARQAILRTQVGETGYVEVLGSDSDNRGRYIISHKGQRDGEDMWDTQDAEGHFTIQSLIDKALALKSGEVATERYQWQAPGDSAPRWKIASIAYYEPWHWVIVASVDENEILAYQRVLEEGQARMIAAASIVGFALALVVGILSVLVARSIARPVIHLADVAQQVSAGNLQVVAKVEERDEIGTLATAFNSMTAQLRDLIDSLETRVAERTVQLRTASEVGQAAASILDPNELLREIVTLIAERFDFYYAAVFVLDQSGSHLILREATGEAGRILKERGHRLHVGLDSMVGYAALKREPRVALNAGEEAVRFANPLLPDTQSEIALPLIVGDQVLGALDVQATQLNAFDETAITTLQNVAAQIAVALQNAQSYSNLQQALAFATRQYELSRAIVTAQTSTEAYESVGQVFALLSGVDRIRLLRVSERDEFDQPAEYELATEWDVLSGAQLDTGLHYIAAETPLAKLVAEDEAIIIPDASDQRLPLATREQLQQAGVQAAILVPLIIRGQFDGFIAATAEQPHDFQNSEVRLLKSVAEQLGVVLSNLQLTNEMQTTLERMALLNRRLSGEAWSSYLVGRDQWLVESGHAQQALTTTGLQVPIVVRGETIGMFNVADGGADRQWQAEELTLLQTIAGEVALALENARLIEQTQRAAQREKDIASAADKIHRSVNLDAILQTAVEEVMRIAGTTAVAIQLGRAETPPDNGRRARSS